MRLDDLGTRVCILGPSNSGKSTLAAAIGRDRGLSVIHLDQFRHQPGTQWKLRPDDEFEALHDAAVATERWIIEGNYSKLLPQRLERATGLILLDAATPASLTRYVRRTWSNRNRFGGLEGTRDAINVHMLTFILGEGRRNRKRYRRLFDETPLPKILLPSRRALQHFYRQQHLRRRA